MRKKSKQKGLTPTKIIVYSVLALKKQDLKQLEKSLKKLLKINFVLENRIDEEIIGGLKIVSGSKIIDLSLQNQLNKIKKLMLNYG